MRATHSINFYCRQSKANKQGYAPIELSITLNGRRVFINLPRSEKPDDFKSLFQSKISNSWN